MIRKMLLPALLLGVLLTEVALAGGVDMREGLWEVTTTTEMTGMPMPMQIPPMTTTQCITPKDMVPKDQQQGAECKMVKNEVNGNTVTWSVVCQVEGGESRGDGTITYHGDSFDGTMKISMEGGMRMTNVMKGRRLGACK